MKVLKRCSNASKIWRRGKKGGRLRTHRFQLSVVTPFSASDTLNTPPFRPLFSLPLSNSFSLRSDETCNQSLLSKMRNDRVKVSAELTISECRFGPAHKFRGLAITFHVPFRHKSEPTDVIRELLLSSFIP